ncbi:hypothetical protein ASG51_21430 [Methylobacterium sp. Leaf465]|uniref:DUF2867 domain-containing protein n=1 Tax=unclassified Methylobacterium TaxID=2615210 RepID=UPI000700B10F|nr:MULTISPECIES: DUF2867 domain-containing protein [unclassified Methylobacterium]KQO66355.1 hypothetical protein ASF18_12735 [Methylobacterium sp. Leaf89]KQT80184.1 hypothetical protein ASG51_21430 [Methylobacterium sp. Leaf465]
MAEAPPVRLLRPREELDYNDTQSVILPTAVSPLDVWNAIASKPRPLMTLAFRVRDAIAIRFGVKAIGGFSRERRTHVCTGDKLDFFLVEQSTPDMLVLTTRDRHLDVMICFATAGRRLTITSSVVVHNAFGRAYMAPVGPIHRMILAADLRRLGTSLAQDASRSGI